VRQTALVVAAAETGKVVNLKKGQFMSPESMQHATKKVTGTGNKQVMITDRGTMFGYQDMIVDFRGIPTAYLEKLLTNLVAIRKTINTL